MEASNRRRVVITGLGVVAPNGIGKEAFWQATLTGISGIKLLHDNCTGQEWAAGVISDFVTEEHIEHKLANRTDRMTHFTLSAIHEALQDAQLLLEQEDPRRIGAVIANAMGGVGFVLKQTPDILYKRTALRQCLHRHCLAQRRQCRTDAPFATISRAIARRPSTIA